MNDEKYFKYKQILKENEGTWTDMSMYEDAVEEYEHENYPRFSIEDIKTEIAANAYWIKFIVEKYQDNVKLNGHCELDENIEVAIKAIREKELIIKE